MPTQRAIFVTGASTGIGRMLTEWLAAAGHLVYAGARRECDLESLGAISNVCPLRLDVTDVADIAAATDHLRRNGSGLDGLVNNAGIVSLAPVVQGTEAEFELVMNVNVHGPYRVTRALAPFIVANRGRIVMISSVAGILADRNVSAYSMSKHAIEAFTDCLAHEMQPVGVSVSVVEPGTYHTNIGRNARARVGDDPLIPDFSLFDEPRDVVAAIALALFEPQPKRRYLVVPNEEEAEKTIRKQIERLVQLNEDHRYTYERRALVRLLDDALATARQRDPTPAGRYVSQ